MINFRSLFFLALLAITGSCIEDDPSGKLQPPSDLFITVKETPGQPGEITLHISAENTNFYKIYYGDKANEVPVTSSEPVLVHTYTASGTYILAVQAHATDAVYVRESMEVTIDLDGDDEGNEEEEVIPGEGYTTPESYEGMTLVWQDEFDGEVLNTGDWTFEKGTGAFGWGNNELQYYREENTTLRDGYLIITAKKEAYQGSEYTSSRVITQDKQSFQYGRIDIRAKVPQGQGIWPALWMLGANFSSVGWPASGEIDIMEMIGGSGRENTVHGTVHWDNEGQHASYGQGKTLKEGTYSDQFHVYSVVWNEDLIAWYVDDVQYNTIDITPAGLSEFRNEFFFIFNVAVGGNWPGSPDASTTFPQSLIVDYVRVFQE